MSLDKILRNTKSVEEFVGSISSHLKSSSNSWLSIAKEFATAKKMLSDKEFKQLRKETRFSYSTVCKLIKIANSTRVKKYRDKLVLIDAWSTLHEIVKLNAEKFAEFETEFLSDNEPRYFKRSDVERIKNGTCANNESDFSVLAVVKVNLKQIDPDGIQKIQSSVEKFAEKLSENELVQFEVNDLTEKLNSMIEEQNEKEVAGLEREARRRAKKELDKAIKFEKSKLPLKKRNYKFYRKFDFYPDQLDHRMHPNEYLDMMDRGQLTSAEMYG